MTREEAIKILNKYDLNFCDIDGYPIPPQDLAEACDMAVEALSAEPTAEYSSDVISRQAAIDAFDGVKVDEKTEYDIGYNDGIDLAVSKLSVLPSAQPERKTDGDTISRQAAIDALYDKGLSMTAWGELLAMKWSDIQTCIELLPSADRPTGHWIEHDDERVLCECSECHEKYLLYEEHVLGRNFCPNCGCAMKGSEEE